jgi:hypothetical protein
MGTPERRDDLLEQIRALPIEDRDYIDALSGRNPRYSREDSVSRAHAAVDAIRSRKP